MTEMQKKMIEKLGLAESDFEKKETVVSNEERINDLEIAVEVTNMTHTLYTALPIELPRHIYRL